MITWPDLSDLIDGFRALSPGKPGFEIEEQSLFSDILTGYNELNDPAGLQTFLEETEENRDDERCRRLLIPMYVQQQHYDAAILMISKLQVEEAERQAFTDYYTLVADIDANNRMPDALTDSEADMLAYIVESDFSIAPFAKSLLEWGRGIEWPHLVDDTPEELDIASLRNGSNGFAGNEPGSTPGRAQSSLLMDASPNPAKAHTVIKVFVTESDSYKKPTMLVKNLTGKLIFKQALKNGWNEVKVPTRNWNSGIYFYSLSVADKMLATKKLSVVK